MKNQRPIENEAVAILRVSSFRQKDGASHFVQEQEVREYCVRNDLDLVRIFKLVESAKDSDDRKEYKNALNFALDNNIRHVLFYMNDRESRNLTDNERNEKLVRAGKISIHYVREGKVLNRTSPDSDFMCRDMQALSNKHFSRNLSAKVNDAMRRKAEDGWYPGNHPPLGYVHLHVRDADGRQKKRGTIIVRDPNEMSVRHVLREYELRAEGHSYDEIRRKIIEEGLVSTNRIKSYHISVIAQRLKNKFYRGLFSWQDREYRGKHELIIPESILRAVDASFESRSIRRGRATGTFSGGWLKCAECGCNIVFDPKTKTIKATGEIKTYLYYHCTDGKRAHVSQQNGNVREELIWTQLERAIEQITISAEFAKLIADEMNKSHVQASEAKKREIDGYKLALKGLEKDEDQIYEHFVSGILDESGYRRQINRVRERREDLTCSLERANSAIDGEYIETANSILELCINAKSLWLSRNAQERRDCLKLVVSNPTLHGSTVRYELKKPFLILSKMNRDERWRARQESNL